MTIQKNTQTVGKVVSGLRSNMKKRILFVYDLKPGKPWEDGLYAALEVLKADFEIDKLNLAEDSITDFDVLRYDFVLGWGAFGSAVDKTVLAFPKAVKKGLCIAGDANEPSVEAFEYAVLFYETQNQKDNALAGIPNTFQAFGINGDIYKLPEKPVEKLWDYIGVGSFSTWKRWEKMVKKPGTKLVIGHYQVENTYESDQIALFCLGFNVMVSNELEAEKLAKFYQASKKAYIPAMPKGGGGERALLEARACGLEVEVEDDNDKLKELLTVPVWDHHYYAAQLKKGLNTVL